MDFDPIDPRIKEYLLSKKQEQQSSVLGEEFGADALAEAQETARRNKLYAGLAEASGKIGSSIAGTEFSNTPYQNAITLADHSVQNLKDRRNQAVQSFDLNQKMTSAIRDEDQFKRESDIASEESTLARTLANKMLPGKDFSKMTATQINKLIPSLTRVYEVEQKKIDRADTRAQNQLTRDTARQEKQDKYLEERNTPFGIARTADDAKKLKEASELKSNLDRKLQEMIDLRKEKGGGAVFDREAVGRGKQLSKDLLLMYKDMAKLGVLSISDEKILNQIIPADPLAFDFVPGQDPIMHTLKKFQGDVEKDFQTRLQTRLKEPPKPQDVGPKANDIEDGYRFKGGDPKDQNNWEKI